MSLLPTRALPRRPGPSFAAGLALAGFVAALTPGAHAQDAAFRDDDFRFEVAVPAGMEPVAPEDAARLLGLPAASFENPPREDAGGAPLVHRWIWEDATSPYGRRLVVELHDGPPLFASPQAIEAAAESAGGRLVGQPRMLPPPVMGARVDAEFEGTQRRAVAFLPDPQGGRNALVTFQANLSDWPIVAAEAERTFASLRLVREAPPAGFTGPSPGATGQPPGRQAPQAGRPPPGIPGAPAFTSTATSAGDPGDWGSLEVIGSFLLGALLLGSLILGGRSAA